MDPYAHHHPLPHHYNPHIPPSAGSSFQVESFQFPSYSEMVEVDSEPDVSIPIGGSGRSSVGDGRGEELEDEPNDRANEIIEQALQIAQERRDQCDYNHESNNHELSFPPMGQYEEMDRRESSFSFRTVSETEYPNGQSTSDDDDHQNPIMHDHHRMPSTPYLQGSGITQTYELSTPVQANKQQATKVLITYADIEGDLSIRKTMRDLYSFLRKNGIDPRVDFMEEMVLNTSGAAWLETQLEECCFVMVCVTSDYLTVVMEDKLSGNKKSSNAEQTTYIYRQIHQEFIESQAKNYRFIPLLVGDGKRNHVPRWLRDTRLYKWPTDYEDLMYRILKVPKFKKPKLGPVPVCTVRKYTS